MYTNNKTQKPLKVTIIYRFLPHYRVDFYNGLHNILKKNNIKLELIYGKNTNVSKNDEVDIDWANGVKNILFKLGDYELFWIPFPLSIFKSDLIIIQQENKILSNFILLFFTKILNKKIAFWGHGINYQSKKGSVGDSIKRFYSTSVNWWFAYTEGVGKLVHDMGFPKNKITNVQNSINTKYFLNKFKDIKKTDIVRFKKKNNIANGPTAIFCGGIYKEKRIEFLIESCYKIKNKIKDFNIIILGSGEQKELIQNFSSKNNWVYYFGSVLGVERVIYFACSDVVLMPGLVGLGILDSFIFQTPLITTSYEYHSPEIEYLKNNYNGLITENNLNNYSEEVVKLLKNKNRLKVLKEGCYNSSLIYTNEKMVGNFFNGIIQCLKV